MITRISHKLVSLVAFGFLIGNQAMAQGIRLDAVTRQVGNQVRASQTESVYGQLAKLNLTLPDTHRQLRSARFQTHGNILIQHFTDGAVLIWDFERGAQVNEFHLTESLVPVRYDAANGDLYVLNNAILERVKRTATALAHERLPQDHAATSFALANDGKAMYLGTSAGEAIKLSANGTLVWKKKILDASIRQLAVSPDGLRLTVLGENNRATTLNGDGSSAFSQTEVTALGGFDRKGKQAHVGSRGDILSVSMTGATRTEGARVEGRLQALSVNETGGYWLAVTKEGRLGQVTGNTWTTIDENVKFAAFLDGTRYLYIKQDGVAYLRGIETAHYLLTLVPSPHGWLVVDHEGRYDGTVAGTKDVIWKADAESLSIDQFFESYFQPGLLSSYLREQSANLGSVPADLTKGAFLPPKIEMKFPGGKMAAGKEIRVVVVAESRGGDLIEGIRLFHNGKRLPPKARLGSQKMERDGRLLLVEVFAFVPEPGANEVFSEARNSHGISGRSSVKREVTDGFRSEGSLHVLGIGVDTYHLQDFNLDFAKADATSVTGQISKGSRGFYKNILHSTLSDATATKASVLKALESLTQVSPDDSLVLVLAGHGATFQGEWYFLPHDMNPKRLKETSISARELQDALVNSPAKKILLMVDACNSGAGIDSFNRYRDFLRRIVQQVGRASGITVLTAARRDQTAAEAPHLGHGLFTYIVLEGLGGLADTNPHDNKITAHELASYVGDNLEKRGALLLEPPVKVQAKDQTTARRFPPATRATPRESQVEKEGVHSQSPAYFVIGSDFPIANSPQ